WRSRQARASPVRAGPRVHRCDSSFCPFLWWVFGAGRSLPSGEGKDLARGMRAFYAQASRTLARQCADALSHSALRVLVIRLSVEADRIFRNLRLATSVYPTHT